MSSGGGLARPADSVNAPSCHRESFLSSRAQRGNLVSMCHREVRSDLGCPAIADRKERLPRCARNDSRGREERGDLGCPAIADRKERLLRRLVFLSSRGTWRSRLYVSSRGTKRSRLSGAGKQKKERLLRRLATPRGGLDKIAERLLRRLARKQQLQALRSK